jgi:carbon-monoxide dehydrogenase medium subunit
MAIRLGHPDNIIDISRIRGLDSIETDSDIVMFGALVTHTQAESSTVAQEKLPLLHKAIPFIGHRAIRNRGTVCGSLAHADPAAELPAVALALDTELIAASTDGARFIAAADFFTGFLSTTLRDDEMLVGARFHVLPAGTATSVQELSRRHGDFALVGLACVLRLSTDGLIASAALSFFGVDSTPSRAAEAEQLLTGSYPSQELFDQAAKTVSNELDPPGDAHASSRYRKHVAGVLTKRALQDCMDQIGVPA